jgi:5-methylcytosine-specific restriction protein A
MESNYGYKFKEHDPEHKIFGSANQIGDAPINPSGDWTSFLPPATEQQNIGVEAECCVSEACKGCIEIIANLMFKDTRVWSARFLAWASGTGTLHGNDPKTVVLALESKGNVLETEWANTSALTTWDEFYTTPPQNIQTEAVEYIAEYAVHSEWVNADVISMQQALQYSPLTVAGYAWVQQPDGLYYSPPNTEPCHDFIIYNCVPNVKWMVFDSYEQDLKQLEWNYAFSDVMRYAITKNVGTTPAELNAWQQFIEWIQKITHTGDYAGEKLGGKARSPQWPAIRNAFIKEHPTCAICGGKKDLNVHHRQSFHEHPELELDPHNLITLCNYSVHHLWFGHLGNFKSINVDIDADAQVWSGKINARP